MLMVIAIVALAGVAAGLTVLARRKLKREAENRAIVARLRSYCR